MKPTLGDEYTGSVPSSQLTIEEATTAEDVESVRQLFLEYAHSLGWDLSQGRVADEIRNLPGPYAPPAGALLLAKVGGQAAGALGLEAVPEDARVFGVGAESFGELKRLYVYPQFRGRGVATALVKRSEEEARLRGYRTLVLTTSAEMFPLAQGLYDALGFTTTETYRSDMPYPGIRWLRLDL